MSGLTRVAVELGERSYTVHVAPSLQGLGAAIRGDVGVERVVLVTESTVGPLWADAARAELAGAGIEVGTTVVLPAGEEHKTLATWSMCVDALLEARIDRATPIVALGGGVLGDVAGFAAATTLRGVPVVQVPTTLLAMVDSSVGGKTAINHDLGKNLVGAFHQPSLVWSALDTLRTLPPRELRAGLGEVVKTALLGDADLYRRLEAEADTLRSGDPRALAPIVARCVSLKAEIVRADEREAGRRAVLNLGHTLGHALETALGHGTLLHGEAVGLGIVAEAAWAARRGLCDPGIGERTERLLGALGLPTAWPVVPGDALRRAVTVDKKVRADRVLLPVPTDIGAVNLVLVSLSDLIEHLGDSSRP